MSLRIKAPGTPSLGSQRGEEGPETEAKKEQPEDKRKSKRVWGSGSQMKEVLLKVKNDRLHQKEQIGQRRGEWIIRFFKVKVI